MQPISLLSIDVGFDVRAVGMNVRLNLPLKGQCAVLHHPKHTTLGQKTSRGFAIDVAESLARDGYSVICFKTINGRDVQCTPRNRAPAGDEPHYEWDGPTWSVQAKNDNYWCSAPTLYAALERAGWTEHDLAETGECSI